MRKDFGAKPWLFPQPFLIIGTYDEKGVPDAMNAAWGGTYDYTEVIVSLSEHKTTKNLRLKKAFTLSFATRDSIVAADYVGIESANKVPNKIAKAGWHAEKAPHVDAPLFQELPLAMECEVKSFEDGILIGKVINVSVDESILKDGEIDTLGLGAVIFDPIQNQYRIVGEAVAPAFKAGLALKK